MVDLREHDDERGHDERVDDLAGDEGVPDAAECAFRVDQVPLDPLLVVDELAVLINIVSDVINHHLLQI